MMKIAIIACLAALAAAEADAWYSPYGYSYMGPSWPMYSSWNYRPGYSYGKRSADAEADAWYRPYMYSGNNWNMMNNWNGDWMNNWNGDMMYWNMPRNVQEGYRYNYGKRSADAEPEADAYYRPYYGNQGFNMYRNQNQGFNNWNMYNQGFNNWNMYNQNQGYNNWNMNNNYNPNFYPGYNYNHGQF